MVLSKFSFILLMGVALVTKCIVNACYKFLVMLHYIVVHFMVRSVLAFVYINNKIEYFNYKMGICIMQVSETLRKSGLQCHCKNFTLILKRY